MLRSPLSAPTLPTLPPELLLHLPTYLPTAQDLFSLCRTSRHLYSVLYPELLRRGLTTHDALWNDTLLHWAAKTDRPVLLRRLVAHPAADVMARNELGWTPLHWAALVGSCECVRVLLGQDGGRGGGEDKDKDEDGWGEGEDSGIPGFHDRSVRLRDNASDIDTAETSNSDSNGANPRGPPALHNALKPHQPNPPPSSMLLSLVNAPSTGGQTPLALACSEGNVAMVRLLLAAGADPRARTRFGDAVAEYVERFPRGEDERQRTRTILELLERAEGASGREEDARAEDGVGQGEVGAGE